MATTPVHHLDRLLELGADPAVYNPTLLFLHHGKNGKYHGDNYCYKLKDRYLARSTQKALASVSKTRLCPSCMLEGLPWDVRSELQQFAQKYKHFMALQAVQSRLTEGADPRTHASIKLRAEQAAYAAKAHRLSERLYEQDCAVDAAVDALLADILGGLNLDDSRTVLVRRAHVALLARDSGTASPNIPYSHETIARVSHATHFDHPVGRVWNAWKGAITEGESLEAARQRAEEAATRVLLTPEYVIELRIPTDSLPYPDERLDEYAKRLWLEERNRMLTLMLDRWERQLAEIASDQTSSYVAISRLETGILDSSGLAGELIALHTIAGGGTANGTVVIKAPTPVARLISGLCSDFSGYRNRGERCEVAETDDEMTIATAFALWQPSESNSEECSFLAYSEALEAARRL